MIQDSTAKYLQTEYSPPALAATVGAVLGLKRVCVQNEIPMEHAKGLVQTEHGGTIVAALKRITSVQTKELEILRDNQEREGLSGTLPLFRGGSQVRNSNADGGPAALNCVAHLA